MTQPFLRYLPAKLKPLGAPTVWIPLTIFTLLSALLWEYYQNPEWFERDPITNANPESNLTPDEQAKLSEVDTVDLLLKGAQVSSPLPNLKTPGDASDVPNPVDSATETDRQLANRNDPFGHYAAEYEFSGASRSSAETPSPLASQNLRLNNGAPVATPSFGSNAGSLPLVTPSTSSALSEAIDRQTAIKANGAQRNDGSSPLTSPLQSPTNVSTPSIRTTPAMSPPTGTAGYRAPATSNLPNFNIAPTATTQNPPAASTSFSPSSPFSKQIGTVQAPPVARPIQSNQIPTVGTVYTAPRSTQPEQNRQAR